MAPHIISYVLPHDYGFAPNPFGGFLTLATCKPIIRRTAKVGDYLLGTGSARNIGINRMIYAAEVTSIVPLSEYGSKRQYAVKRPRNSSRNWKRHGDNIYHVVANQYRQRPNPYHLADSMDHDLSGKNALICTRFWYFGRAAIELPNNLVQLKLVKKGPGHKRIKTYSIVKEFIDWLASLPAGNNGSPEGTANNVGSCETPTAGPAC